MTQAATVVVEALSVSHGQVHAVRDLGFSAMQGEFLTLLGPSGCGKTTTLRAIAGLEVPHRGRIVIAGKPIFDADARINLAPERRGLGMVFQSYAIWPHMTVFENVAFGLRARGVAKAELTDAVRKSLDLVGLAAFADRSATRLSGGQQQRVALARSIAANSGVLLMDEPLSNLDAQLRLAMREELKALQRRLGLTAIYVTHDLEEALVLSDRIVVMREGMLEQSGTPAELHRRPGSRFVAEFLGVRNIFPCRIEYGTNAILRNGVALSVTGLPQAGSVCVCFRSSSVSLSPVAAPGFHTATLVASIFLGDLMQFELDAGGIPIIARGLPRDDIAPGSAVFWSVSPDACFLIPA